MKNGITITLDKPRTLRYGMNALAKIEDITGKSILALDLNQVGIKDLLAIIYGGLYHEDKTLTIEKVGDLIDEYSDINEVAEKIGEALTQAFGGAKTEQTATPGGKVTAAFDLYALSEKAVVAWGVDPLVVGEYTPFELALIAKQKRQAEQVNFENLLTLAWHTEALARQRKLPRLEKLLREARKKPNSKASSKSDAILKAMAAAKGVIIK